jgi:exopolysaccharide biosynthesis protein
LEDIAKQMELMSNIDLDKLLQTVSVKDAKIKVLQQETHDTKEAIAQIYRNKSKEVKTISQVAQEETKAKLQAF